MKNLKGLLVEFDAKQSKAKWLKPGEDDFDDIIIGQFFDSKGNKYQLELKEASIGRLKNSDIDAMLKVMGEDGYFEKFDEHGYVVWVGDYEKHGKAILDGSTIQEISDITSKMLLSKIKKVGIEYLYFKGSTRQTEQVFSKIAESVSKKLGFQYKKLGKSHLAGKDIFEK